MNFETTLLSPKDFTYLEDWNVVEEDVWVYFEGVTNTMGYNFCTRELEIFETSSQAIYKKVQSIE